MKDLAGKVAVVVGDVDVAQQRPGVDQRFRHARLFDIHMKEIGERDNARMIDAASEIGRLLDPVQERCFVAVERLQKELAVAVGQR